MRRSGALSSFGSRWPAETASGRSAKGSHHDGAGLHISCLPLPPMPALVVLPFRCIDVLRVDGTPSPARTRTTPGTILRLALGQLRRHLGVTRRLALRSHVAAWHLDT